MRKGRSSGPTPRRPSQHLPTPSLGRWPIVLSVGQISSNSRSLPRSKLSRTRVADPKETAVLLLADREDKSRDARSKHTSLTPSLFSKARDHGLECFVS